MVGGLLTATREGQTGSNPNLSPREKEVLQLVADGLTNIEIAEKLIISVQTVKNHISSILYKLDAVNRTNAVVKGLSFSSVTI